MVRYERLRANHSGVGAARLRAGYCEGCRIQINPVDLSQIRSAPAEEVLYCEDCGRILVRTEESGL
jgi:predicted  nucleic acid-binding Zn-ribbon protein